MKRRELLLMAAGAAAAASAVHGTAGFAGATSYFVSQHGDDAANGRTPKKAWKSIARANVALGDGTVRPGESILFKRGQEFFGSIDSQPPHVSGVTEPLVTLGAYGNGPRPRISGYKILDVPHAWYELRPGIWRTDITDPSSFHGNVSSRDANVGFLRVDQKIYGAKKRSVEELKEQWDFVTDEEFLYVRSEVLPTTLASDLRAAPDGILIRGFSGLSVTGLELVGSGGHGYQQRSANRTRVSNCRIHEIGGALLGGSGEVRYGNGVELWMGSSNVTVSNNEIFDIYDVACTVQGWQEPGARSIVNCTFEDNVIFDCSQAFEYWGRRAKTPEQDGVVKCSFIGNTCVRSGYSWSSDIRPDKFGKGTFVLVHDQELAMEVSVTDNVFFDAKDCYMFVAGNGSRLNAGAYYDRNAIALRGGTAIQAGLSPTIEDWRSWVARTGLEENSKWSVVPSSIRTTQDALDFVRTERARPPRRRDVEGR